MQKAARAMAAIAGLIPAAASAQVQGVDLNGRYQCVAMRTSAPGSSAFITQYGSRLNIVNEAGTPSRASGDYPGRIRIEQANQGAIYSPDGIRIQFDRGTVWQRVREIVFPPPAPPPPPVRVR